MKRRLLIGVLGLLLSACQALAAANPVPPAPTPKPTATSAPTQTPHPTAIPPTPTATAKPTATATATAMPTPDQALIDAWLSSGVFNRIPATRTPIPTLRPLTLAPRPFAATPLTATLRVFAIGDSVMLGAANELRRAVAGIEVDAQVSRHIGATLSILQQRRAAGRLGRIVIVHIGDNGYLSASQFEDLLQLLADVPRVIVVNLKEPRPWETANNRVIAEAVSHYPNAVLVNWHDFGARHPEVFAPDGIHIGGTGAQDYVALLLPVINAP